MIAIGAVVIAVVLFIAWRLCWWRSADGYIASPTRLHPSRIWHETIRRRPSPYDRYRPVVRGDPNVPGAWSIEIEPIEGDEHHD